MSRNIAGKQPTNMVAIPTKPGLKKLSKTVKLVAKCSSSNSRNPHINEIKMKFVGNAGYHTGTVNGSCGWKGKDSDNRKISCEGFVKYDFCFTL